MKKQMLINAVHLEQKRMAIVEDGKLVEFNIQMAVKEPITGNIYKGIVMKVERGLQAAFVSYGGKKDGFLPLKDVSYNNFTEPVGREGNRPTLKVGQEVLVQVLREVSERKGALLTAYISLPGRYLVLLPNKESSGISRKIEDEGDRKRLKELVEQITTEDGLGFIVRTAGMNRTKQELARDYQHLSRLWKEIQKRSSETAAPSLIYQESAFGVRSLRDYFTPDIEEILVDDMETFRQMRAYSKAVAPRIVKVIKLDKEKTPLFDKFQLEDQIRVIYQERVELKSGGYLIINPTEAMITIDVNSGRGSSKRNVEETAFKTNMEAAEEIARQLRLRDLGGLVVIDFIDMMDQKHNAEVEKAFKKAIDLDRARIQLSHISKFGIMELSRQKKQSTIQEISYMPCPFCRGRGVRPSLEYTALTSYRKIETQAVKGLSSQIRVSLPYEVAEYLLNQKRSEIIHLESEHEMSIHISGTPGMAWDECRIETTKRETPHTPETTRPALEAEEPSKDMEELEDIEESEAPETEAPQRTDAPKQNGVEAPPAENLEPIKKKSHRRSRHRRKKPGEKPTETSSSTPAPPAAPPATAIPAAAETKSLPAPDTAPPPAREPVRIKPPAAVIGPVPRKSILPPASEAPEKANATHDDPLQRLKKVFETLID
jgi:ribonuclease E